MWVNRGNGRVAAVGAIICAVAGSYHVYEIVTLNSVTGPAVALALDGGLGAATVYAGYRLGETGFSTAAHRRIARWTVAGASIAAVVIGATFAVRLVEGRQIVEPVFPLLVATSAGALTGTIAGYYAVNAAATARRFEAIFNNTFQSTLLLAPDGTVIEVNETALAFGDLERGQVVGRRLWNTYWFQAHEEGRRVVQQAVEQAREGEFVRSQIQVQGHVRDAIIDFSLRPLLEDTGEVELLVAEGRNVTESQRQREHLGVLQRYLRHNMRNKLTVIQGFATALLDETQESDRREQLRRVRQNAVELSASTEQIKELSDTIARRDVHTRQVDVVEALEQAVDQMSGDEERVELSCSETTAIVEANEMLQEALGRLIESVLEYADGEGSVRTDIDKSTDAVQINVECVDCDIPSEELLAFESTDERTTTHHPTGIGLWFARSVVESHGGSISYENDAEEPTRVEIQI